MKQSYIIHEHHPRLLLFFAGWGADETPFKMYRPVASDFMVCYDYRTLDLTPPDWKNTAKSTSSAGLWGYGRLRRPCHSSHRQVRPAKVSIWQTASPSTERPTHRPAYGIPPAIYHGTLDGLTGASLHKFLRRMCANGAAFKAFLEITPRRPLEELRDELTEIEKMYHTLPAATFHWQQAVTGGNDRIIPPANQLQAWEILGTPVLQTEDAHYQEELFRHYLQDLWTSH